MLHITYKYLCSINYYIENYATTHHNVEDILSHRICVYWILIVSLFTCVIRWEPGINQFFLNNKCFFIFYFVDVKKFTNKIISCLTKKTSC